MEAAGERSTRSSWAGVFAQKNPLPAREKGLVHTSRPSPRKDIESSAIASGYPGSRATRPSRAGVGSLLPGAYTPVAIREPSSLLQWRDRAGFTPASPFRDGYSVFRTKRTLVRPCRAVKAGNEPAMNPWLARCKVAISLPHGPLSPVRRWQYRSFRANGPAAARPLRACLLG